MPITFTEGVIGEPQLTVIYGVAGIGKSTLAAQWPDPIFLDTEKGSRRLAVPRLTIESLKDFKEALAWVAGKDGKRFKTVVVDTVDWLEAKIREAVVSKYSEKDRAFDREGGFIANELMPILSSLSGLREKGKHVVLLAHSAMITVDLPDQKASFQRYELDMNKKHTAPLVKHWGDNLFFLRWKLSVRESDEVKNKGIGGTERLLCVTNTAAYDAKNRYGMAGEFPGGPNWADAVNVIRDGFLKVGAEWEPINHTATEVVAQSPTPVTVPATAKANATQGEPAGGVVSPHETKPELTPERVGIATTPASAPAPEMLNVQRVAAEAQGLPVPPPAKEVAKEPVDVTKDAQRAAALAPLEGDEIPMGESSLNPAFVKIATDNEAAANAFLIDRKEIKEGHTWRDVSPAYVTRVLRNPAGWVQQANKFYAGGGK